MHSQPVMVPDLSHGHLQIVAWKDARPQDNGHDPRSMYVEMFWLGILGPSAVWLMRYLARLIEDAPSEGTWLEVQNTALAIGLASGRNRTTVFERTIERLVRFNVASTVNSHTLGVSMNLPGLSSRQIARLPPELVGQHQQWMTNTRSRPDSQVSNARARELALTLLQLGESTEDTTAQLCRWRVTETIAHEATAWASVQ